MSTLAHSVEARQARAYEALIGLSVGDAFGQLFFHHDSLRNFARTGQRPEQMPDAPWPWTDDTAMASAIYENLRTYSHLNADALAMSFGMNYVKDPNRAYGASMHDLLPRLARGSQWQLEARKLYAGQGSYGNGASMRVGVLGAYFADELSQVQAAAEESARITHAHPEAVAGAVAVAVAAALAWRFRGQERPSRAEFLDLVLDHVPISEVRSKLARARQARDVLTVYTAAQMFGNGSQITSMDTVPFALFSAAEHLDDYEVALWATGEALGDVDTTCAIVGGIVIGYTGRSDVPVVWHDNREALPEAVIPA